MTENCKLRFFCFEMLALLPPTYPLMLCISDVPGVSINTPGTGKADFSERTTFELP